VPRNYNWITKDVQKIIIIKKSVKKWDPLLDMLIPELNTNFISAVPTSLLIAPGL
jgi:hypothetical protein